MGFILMIR